QNNRTGFIDQSGARATRQAHSIRVLHAGHAAHYILLLSRVLLWLTAFLSRMPLDCRETQDWLRPGGPICLRPNPTPHFIYMCFWLNLRLISNVFVPSVLVDIVEEKVNCFS
uniref:G_PROTEIN_RECEP_F1_2 domain-containing protein n=1 Tax=Mesocestoides corti TaxID=53468 RepID=A0A5K3EM78_MESCO